jgi:hypothetical protein
MLFKEIIAIYSENHTKLINILCGHSAELLTVELVVTYSYHWVLKVQVQKNILIYFNMYIVMHWAVLFMIGLHYSQVFQQLQLTVNCHSP